MKLNSHVTSLGRSAFRLLSLGIASAVAVGCSGYFNELLDSPARVGDSAEEAVKAAYVYNFAKLTKWPSSAPSGPLVIGIIGSSGAGAAITRIVDGKDAGGRTINVKSISASAAKTCHIVFVCGSGGPPAVGSSPVLTVGEKDGFASDGGAIGFVSDGGKVRFELNKKVVKKADLDMDSKLEAIAKVVG